MEDSFVTELQKIAFTRTYLGDALNVLGGVGGGVRGTVRGIVHSVRGRELGRLIASIQEGAKDGYELSKRFNYREGNGHLAGRVGANQLMGAGVVGGGAAYMLSGGDGSR